VFDLQQFIKSNKLKQSDVAEIVGVSQPVVSMVVNGRSPCPDRWVELLREHYGDVDAYAIEEPAAVYETKKAGPKDPAEMTIIERLAETIVMQARIIENMQQTMAEVLKKMGGQS
jgi:predicted transcriptional regulator